MDDLFKKYMPDISSTENVTVVDPTFEKFGLTQEDTKRKTLDQKLQEGPTFIDTVKKIGKAIPKGIEDMAFTANKALLYIDKALGNEGANERIEKFNNYVKTKNEEFAKDATVSSEVGRIGGQILATAPLVPARLLQGASVISRALPTTLATGEQVAAPLLNRIGALGLQGGIAGTIQQTATTSARPDIPLPVDMATGLATGIVAGPAAHGAVVAASKIPVAAKSLWANININKLASQIGISPSAAKNIVGRLDEAGLTPADAALMVQKMGPKATLADIDESLITEASGLASRGGKSTALLKGVYSDRAATADNEAVKILETKLGPKPDIQVEKDKIIDEARKLTSADYTAAHKSTTPVDASGVVKYIDDTLDLAVGKEAAEINKARGYLYDDKGNLKTGVKALHKVRQALDDRLGELPKEGTSQKSSTFRAISTIRDKVDEQLKLVPEMLKADTIFAEKMGIAKGIDYGYKAFSSGTREEFEKIWNNATPEIKDTIRKGMIAAAHDVMELSQKGQMSGAQRQFGKKSVNREKLRMAFGSNADEVLDSLATEASFRATENLVNRGAQTAERQAVQRRYGDDGKGSGNFIKDAAFGAAVDLSTGASGAATGMMAARNIGSGAKQRFLSVGMDNMAEGSADLLSRQGVMRDSTIDALGRVKAIRDKFASPTKSITSKLPIITGEPLVDYLRTKFDKL